MQYNCPLCEAQGKNYIIRLANINTRKAVFICENTECCFPIGVGYTVPQVIKRRYSRNVVEEDKTQVRTDSANHCNALSEHDYNASNSDSFHLDELLQDKFSIVDDSLAFSYDDFLDFMGEDEPKNDKVLTKDCTGSDSIAQPSAPIITDVADVHTSSPTLSITSPVITETPTMTQDSMHIVILNEWEDFGATPPRSTPLENVITIKVLNSDLYPVCVPTKVDADTRIGVTNNLPLLEDRSQAAGRSTSNVSKLKPSVSAFVRSNPTKQNCLRRKKKLTL